MRQIRVLLFLMMSISAIHMAWAGEAPDSTTPTPAEQEEYQTYTVKPNDTLYLIAVHFNTTPRTIASLNNLTNPNVIVTGQVLKIPYPVALPALPNITRYTVQRGETLAQIAKKFDTTTIVLSQLNDITNPNLIFAGQIINVPLTVTDGEHPVITPTAEIEPTFIVEQTPEAQAPLETETPVPPQPTETPFSFDATEIPTEVATETPSMPVEIEPTPDLVTTEIPSTTFYSGVEVYYEGQDLLNINAHLQTLDLPWIRLRVDWRHIEPEQGVYEFAELDTAINTFYADNRSILLVITNAPAWARTTSEENGPPDDLALFETFLQTLLTRYDDQISAYQIWDEPNLRRNWNCDRRICELDYIELLQLASTTIWNHNPNILVISAGLAPTRFNDYINAIDDRIYLEGLLSNGLGMFVDGIGIHPGGEANPPDSVCCEAVNNITSHYENEVFYFLANLQGYHQIISAHGLVNVPLWVTKFGWGTGEDVNPPSNPNQPHYSIRYTSLTEQAIYIPRALELGQELGYIQAMFINNLNGCYVTLAGGLPELCFPSLIGPDGLPRPAYSAVQNLP
jgi:LysM repeat protein